MNIGLSTRSVELARKPILEVQRTSLYGVPGVDFENILLEFKYYQDHILKSIPIRPLNFPHANLCVGYDVLDPIILVIVLWIFGIVSCIFG